MITAGIPALLCVIAQQGAPQAVQKVDFDELARTFLEDSGLGDMARAGAAGHTFEELLEGPAFVRLDLVGLDLRFPTVGLKASSSEDFRDAVGALLEVQHHWQEWLHPESASDRAEDWKTVNKWVKSWSRSKLGSAEGGRSLVESLGGGEEVKAALDRLSSAVTPSEASAPLDGSPSDPGRLLLTMDRKTYLGVLSVAGWLDDKLRTTLWDDRVLGSTFQWVGWTEIVALEFASLPIDPKSPFAGVPLTKGDKTELLQYSAERGAVLLLRNQFRSQPVHFFEQALVANLVIDASGRNNLRAGEWKLEYKTSGASTAPYERFVPGGNPAGGTLPPRPAGPGATTGNATQKSLYRSTEGADHFLGPLREGQKTGAKLVSKDKKNPLRDDKNAHFVLHSFEENEDRPITAPFLGEVAEKKALPPDGYLDDYEDFFRAYRSGFLYWLQLHGMPDEAQSHERFRDLLRAHAGRNPLQPMDEIFASVYGVPLTHEDGSVDSLEWRYLDWLASKKK